ncbi:sensor histidine kinase [Tepidibacter hydrothermalis]|uniref:histidine kinase n=1 Tax=Tepidibacter hydrothermalis TaxID=3036126 RepID=A0ABY8EAW2_9FIRM|nr:ATP-binding protein [Tepidibacter hydrothermalis]WFD10073.1 ATP-binding protein [Tepidibacter hydrothermalis]
MNKIDLNIFKNKRISISFKITAIYAIMLSLILITISIMTNWQVRRILVDQTKEELKKTYQSVEKYIQQGKSIDENLFQEINLNNIYLRISNENKVVLESKYKAVDKDIYNHLDSGGIGHDNYEWEDIDKVDIFYMYKEVSKETKLYSILLIKNIEEQEEFLLILNNNLIIMNILGIIIAILSSIYLSKKFLSPIQKITNTAKEISIHDLNSRIDVGGPDDELKELACTFNDMIQRLEESFEKQKQFVSDASHELRTPISVIQGYINLLDRWGKDNKDVLDESIDAIKSETVNMKRLLEQLLFLAKGDNKSYNLDKVEFELSKLIQDIVKETRLIDDKHKIICTLDKNILINADPKLIKQMLRILIDNSIKFTPKNGNIIINLQKHKSYILISIEDSGIGIPDKDIPYIFDRFYRADKSRTKATGGSGLGLSIAKRIVQDHKGSIEVESELQKGTKMIIKLPVDKIDF